MKMIDVMTPCPYRITGETSVVEALEVMHMRGIRHLPVIAEDNLIGVLTERDARLSQFTCEIAGHCPRVGAICAKYPFVVQSDQDVAAVALEMAEKKIDCALVSDIEGNFVGIFTSTDACRLIYLLLAKEE